MIFFYNYAKILFFNIQFYNSELIESINVNSKNCSSIQRNRFVHIKKKHLLNQQSFLQFKEIFLVFWVSGVYRKSMQNITTSRTSNKRRIFYKNKIIFKGLLKITRGFRITIIRLLTLHSFFVTISPKTQRISSHNHHICQIWLRVTSGYSPNSKDHFKDTVLTRLKRYKLNRRRL